MKESMFFFEKKNQKTFDCLRAGRLVMGQFIGVWSFAVAATLLACSTACHAAGTEKILYDFTGGADGGYPLSGLTKVGTTFYGTTTKGGTYGYGTIYSLTEAGTFTALYSFKGYPDAFDVESPMLYKDGALYGLSGQGGEGGAGDHGYCKHYDSYIGCGTVFKVTLDGQESILYAFSNSEQSDGFEPSGTLVPLGDKLYGETDLGGANKWGTIFSITKSGKEEPLYAFPDENHGGPVGLTAVNGVLYGATTGLCYSAFQGGEGAMTARLGSPGDIAMVATRSD